MKRNRMAVLVAGVGHPRDGYTVTHSHLRIQHLLKKLEEAPNRPERDARPGWIRELVQEVADLFEPHSGLARVGFDCQWVEDYWEIGMYLGKTEIVGGKDDGTSQLVNFQFDLLSLVRIFHLVERCEWSAVPESVDESCVLLEGFWRTYPIKLKITMIPPEEAGPGMRKYPDGRLEET